MCMMLYIAANETLPLIAWNKRQPAFNVSNIGRFSRHVRTQFSKPHVYFVGAHTGCSCGFLDSQIESDAKASICKLSEYLSNALETTETLELFSCWCGDENTEPETRQTLTPQDIMSDDFVLDELQFITVKK